MRSENSPKHPFDGFCLQYLKPGCLLLKSFLRFPVSVQGKSWHKSSLAHEMDALFCLPGGQILSSDQDLAQSLQCQASQERLLSRTNSTTRRGLYSLPRTQPSDGAVASWVGSPTCLMSPPGQFSFRATGQAESGQVHQQN